MTVAPCLWIAESDVVELIDMAGAVRALEHGLREESRGAAVNMTKTHVAWPAGTAGHAADATLHAIGAAFLEDGFAGTKTWAHTPGGATPLVILYDSRHGELRAIVEAFAMGQLRTGAASGLATRELASADASELALIGTGRQALAQVAAVHVVRPLRKVRVFGRDRDARRRMADAIRAQIGVDVLEAESVADAVRDAPIVTTVTRAREPFLEASMMARGSHINAVGAIVPSGAEIAADVVARCTRIAADSPAQARRLSRELLDGLGPADEAWTRVERLADVVAQHAGRRPPDDLTLFKSLGMGISDLSLAMHVYREAVRTGLGRAMPHPQTAHPRLVGNVRL
jgi:ornithine cyclodeaminase/alanine dehydrogenase-like protein (mu-crystallin family)